MLRPEIDPPQRRPLSRLMLAGALGALLVATACAQQVPRDPTPTPPTPQPATATPTPAPTPTATPAPPATPTAMPPPPSPTPTPTAPQPLFLEVQGPEDGATVRNSAVVVHGRTAPGATVTVGTVSIVADRDGRFQLEVQLELGANRIEVVASDAAGRSLSATRTVTFEAPASTAFFLLVTEPEDQTVVSASRQPITGRTAPDAIVSVNGVGVEVDEAGAFSTTVTLEPGPNLIEVVGTSPDGRVLGAVLAVIFRP